MTSELKLAVRCPECSKTTLKTLSKIKSEHTFRCSCGYFTELQRDEHNNPKIPERRLTAEAV